MTKKTLCALLCALLMFTAAGCSSPATAPTSSPIQLDPPQSAGEADAPQDDAPVFYTVDDAEYRDLYAHNAIEEALSGDFIAAMTTEDFNLLAGKYLKAWEDEYHALMDELIAAYPSDAEDLMGLRDYTDDAANEAYEATYAQHFYIDENGDAKPADAAEQNADFDKAEVYKCATILSILNDYRGETPYAFHYKAQ